MSTCPDYRIEKGDQRLPHDCYLAALKELTTLRAKVAAMQGVVNAVARFSNGLVGYRTEEIVAAYRKYKEVVR